MKLYLSSFRIGNRSQELVEMCQPDIKLAVIANAIDSNPEAELRKTKVSAEIFALAEIGIKSEEIDLREFFGKPESLALRLENFGGLWVRGGNTFILRRAMAYSGLDHLIIQKSTSDNFIYGGYSAGVSVLGPDIHGCDLVDPVDDIPEGYQRKVIWEGLNLIDYYFAPHFRSVHPESHLIENLIKYFTDNDLPYKALHDGDVIIDRC